MRPVYWKWKKPHKVCSVVSKHDKTKLIRNTVVCDTYHKQKPTLHKYIYTIIIDDFSTSRSGEFARGIYKLSEGSESCQRAAMF